MDCSKTHSKCKKCKCMECDEKEACDFDLCTRCIFDIEMKEGTRIEVVDVMKDDGSKTVTLKAIYQKLPKNYFGVHRGRLEKHILVKRVDDKEELKVDIKHIKGFCYGSSTISFDDWKGAKLLNKSAPTQAKPKSEEKVDEAVEVAASDWPPSFNIEVSTSGHSSVCRYNKSDKAQLSKDCTTCTGCGLAIVNFKGAD